MKIKCVQTLKHLFNHTDKTISNGYIIALAPRLMEYLHSKSINSLSSESDLQLTIEIINAVESLIRLAEPDKGKYNLLIRLRLCSFKDFQLSIIVKKKMNLIGYNFYSMQSF